MQCCVSDVFAGPKSSSHAPQVDLHFEHFDMDMSNTSIASFHEIPPQKGSSPASTVESSGAPHESNVTGERGLHHHAEIVHATSYQHGAPLVAITEETSSFTSSHPSDGSLRASVAGSGSSNEKRPSLPSPPVSPTSLEANRSQSHRQPLSERLKRVVSPPPLAVSSSVPSISPGQASAKLDLPARAHTLDFDQHGQAVGTPVSATFDFTQPGMDIADMDMRSALDRLVDDVNSSRAMDVDGADAVPTKEVSHSRADRSNLTISDGDVSVADTEILSEEGSGLLSNLPASMSTKERPTLGRAGTAPVLSLPSTFDAPVVPGSRVASNASVPPSPPPKDGGAGNGKSARQQREELIREKRREARARDSGEYVPPRRDGGGNLLELEGSPASRRAAASGGRPSARRSLSTGDAEDLMSVVRLLWCFYLLFDW